MFEASINATKIGDYALHTSLRFLLRIRPQNDLIDKNDIFKITND